jgi:hypothetical protein
MFHKLTCTDSRFGIRITFLTYPKCMALFSIHDGPFISSLGIDETSHAANKVTYPTASFTDATIESIRDIISSTLDIYELAEKLHHHDTSKNGTCTCVNGRVFEWEIHDNNTESRA